MYGGRMYEWVHTSLGSCWCEFARKLFLCTQEAAGSPHGSVKSIKNYIFGILTLRPINWYRYGSIWGGGRVGGSPSGVLVFWRGGSNCFLGHLYGILTYHRNPQLKPSQIHPFKANCFKRGVCGHDQKSEAHALGCRQWGESANGAAIQTSRIVSMR